MPKLLFARPAINEIEAARINRLSRSRHAPQSVIQRAQMIHLSWQGQRTSAIAEALGCHVQTVREGLQRFNELGLSGLRDRPRSGRPRRLSEAERSLIISLVKQVPPGRLQRAEDGDLVADDVDAASQWTLDDLTRAAHGHGVQVQRSQVRRILRAEGIQWRQVRSWLTSHDPDFAKKEPLS